MLVQPLPLQEGNLCQMPKNGILSFVYYGFYLPDAHAEFFGEWFVADAVQQSPL